MFVFVDNNNFTSFQTLILLSLVRFRITTITFFPFLILKKKAVSFFFELPHILFRALNDLANLIFLPLVETINDCNSFVYRPYRDSYDFFARFPKIFFSLKEFKHWFLKFDLNKFTLSPDYLLRNFPFEKRLIFFLMTDVYTTQNYFKNRFEFSSFITFSVMLSFLLRGLVFGVTLNFLF